jgi:hypothetical protein
MPGINNSIFPEAQPDPKILNGTKHGNGTIKENILNQDDISRHANGTAPAGISTTLPNKPLPRVADDLIDRSIDQPPRLRVAVIGAGLAGVQAGVLLPAKVPNIELVIFEKNAGVVCNLPLVADNKFKCPCSHLDYREELGLKTFIQACAVTSLHMSTSRHMSQM